MRVFQNYPQSNQPTTDNNSSRASIHSISISRSPKILTRCSRHSDVYSRDSRHTRHFVSTSFAIYQTSSFSMLLAELYEQLPRAVKMSQEKESSSLDWAGIMPTERTRNTHSAVDMTGLDVSFAVVWNSKRKQFNLGRQVLPGPAQMVNQTLLEPGLVHRNSRPPALSVRCEGLQRSKKLQVAINRIVSLRIITDRFLNLWWIAKGET